MTELWEKTLVPEFLKELHSRTDLEGEVSALKAELATLRRALEASPMQVRIIETHDVSADEAQMEVSEYLEQHGKGYPSEIANHLGISLEDVVNALEELTKRGAVRPRE